MILKKLFHKPLTDEELIRRYRETGELKWVADLFQRYMSMIFGVCMKYLKEEEESKDLVMQIFEKLADTLKKSEVQHFKNWLHVIVKNQCLMYLRLQKNKNEKTVPLHERFQSEQDSEEDNFGENLTSTMENRLSWNPTDEDLLEQHLSLLEKGIANLPVEQKVCIELFYLKEKCYKEVSEITGYELSKVKSYIQNGKRNLKIYLEKLIVACVGLVVYYLRL
jgi:RNA polymerase sigma-70 factor (ECF subfamily)